MNICKLVIFLLCINSSYAGQIADKFISAFDSNYSLRKGNSLNSLNEYIKNLNKQKENLLIKQDKQEIANFVFEVYERTRNTSILEFIHPKDGYFLSNSYFKNILKKVDLLDLEALIFILKDGRFSAYNPKLKTNTINNLVLYMAKKDSKTIKDIISSMPENIDFSNALLIYREKYRKSHDYEIYNSLNNSFNLSNEYKRKYINAVLEDIASDGLKLHNQILNEKAMKILIISTAYILTNGAFLALDSSLGGFITLSTLFVPTLLFYKQANSVIEASSDELNHMITVRMNALKAIYKDFKISKNEFYKILELFKFDIYEYNQKDISKIISDNKSKFTSKHLRPPTLCDRLLSKLL